MAWAGQPNQQYGGYGQAQNHRPPGPGGYGGGAPPQGQGYQQQAAYGQQPYGQQMQHQGGVPHGYGAPPGNPYGGFGQSQPPPGISPDLWQWFQSVDQDRSGKITTDELQKALMNGNWTPFNNETCRLMIGMFDRDRSGTIDIHEFAALWKYIQDWKACFDRFDTDRSGNIDAAELANALKTFGYNLSANFSALVVRMFDKNGLRNIQFDDFIQACVMLKGLTDQFRVKDTNQNGSITISYEEFLTMVLDNTIIRG